MCVYELNFCCNAPWTLCVWRKGNSHMKMDKRNLLLINTCIVIQRCFKLEQLGGIDKRRKGENLKKRYATPKKEEEKNSKKLNKKQQKKSQNQPL